MNDTTKIMMPFAAIAGLALSATSAHATVVFTGAGSETEVNSTTELFYDGDQSASDLINGLTPIVSGWFNANGAHSDELTDGIHGGNFAAEGNTVSGTWTTVGATAEYTLGTGANGLGYDITSIQSIAAWVNVKFGNQAWKVEVTPVGGSITTLATVDYQPLAGGGATKVTLSGLDATGIESIKFTANSVNGGANGGAFIWRELDVFGTSTAVPEPSSTALLGLGGLALIFRRRK